MGAFYEESGRVNVLSTLLSFLGAAVVIVFLAYGYSFLTNVNPFIYVNFLATLVYVIILGGVFTIVKRVGKVRSFSALMLVAFVLSLFGLYAVWVTYISVAFEKEMLYGASHFSHGIDVLANRSFSIGRALRSSSIEFSGGMLYALWIIEALILLFGPVFFIYSLGKNEQIYCEDCEKWAEEEVVYLKRTFSPVSKDSILSLIQSNSLQSFLEMDEAFDGDRLYYEIKFVSCGRCRKAYYLSVNRVVNQQNSKGENEKKEELIFPFYELDLHMVPRQVQSSVKYN